MNHLLLECTACGKIFPSGIAMSPGSSATFINTKSRCNYCGSMASIPDGTFRSTVEGFINVLESSGDPLGKAKELLKMIQESKTADDLLKIKKTPSLSSFEKWIPNSPEKIAAYIAIIYTIIQLWAKTPNTRIEYNTFVNQYNQNINITVNNNLTSLINE